MARKSFRKRVTRKTQRKIKPDEVNSVIEKTFIDSRGNKSILRFDFNPHPISKPTIQLDANYGDK